MKPEVDQEIKDAMRIYKFAGPIIIIILLIGVLYAVLHKEPAPQPTPPIIPPVQEVKQETLPEPINITPDNVTNAALNATENVTINASSLTNTTLNNATNTTPNMTVNLTNQANITTAQVVNLTWDGITINFPDTIKRVNSAIKSHHYIEILEKDATPLTNGEQFDMAFIIGDKLGRETEVIPNFENNKWLITLLITNEDNYTLTVSITCEEGKGHCQRFYPPGGVNKSTEVEVV